MTHAANLLHLATISDRLSLQFFDFLVPIVAPLDEDGFRAHADFAFGPGLIPIP